MMSEQHEKISLVDALKLISIDGLGMKLTYEEWEHFRKMQEASESFNRSSFMIPGKGNPVAVTERRSNIGLSLDELDIVLSKVEKEASDLGMRIESILSPEQVPIGRATESAVPSPPKADIAVKIDCASNRLRSLLVMLGGLNSRIEL